MITASADCIQLHPPFLLLFFWSFFSSPAEVSGEEMSKEEKNLALMAMKKKDKRLYDRIMHSKKKKRSEVGRLPFY